MRHLALLIVRVTVGGLLAGHGAQKLFGSFGGHGLRGTGGWLESIGLRPGRPWAVLAGSSEFFGGLLTALGLLNPIGPLMTIGAMLMATVKVHAGKPVWGTAGGAELPLTNLAVATALVLVGPGRLSLDTLLRIRLSRWLAVPGLVAAGAAVALASRQEATPAAGGQSETAGTDAPDGGDAEPEGASPSPERSSFERPRLAEASDAPSDPAGNDAERAFAEAAAAMTRTEPAEDDRLDR